MTLLADVVPHLERNDVRVALIGAEALSVYGFVRATLDIDLMTVSNAVLSNDFWKPLDERASIDVRRGDHQDPLAGVVRLNSRDGEQLDVVVGKYKFQKAVIDRAEQGVFEEVSLLVARLADLVLLKLFAGGRKDAWDIQRVLESSDETLVVEVEQYLPELPDDAQQLWAQIRGAHH